jgi:uncharacterized membrane protein
VKNYYYHEVHGNHEERGVLLYAAVMKHAAERGYLAFSGTVNMENNAT